MPRDAVQARELLLAALLARLALDAVAEELEHLRHAAHVGDAVLAHRLEDHVGPQAADIR